MKRTSLVAAGALLLLANALALAHAWRNRTGTPEAQVTLTSRELAYFSRVPSDDDSGVTLHLLLADSHPIDRQILQRLGFDCSVDPARVDAPRFYQRQKPRQAFVALENDGPAWQAWHAGNSPGSYVPNPSHLIAIDADRNAASLRSRHPDRTSVVIVPAVVTIALNSFDRKLPAEIGGRVELMSSEVHVPRPFSERFRSLKKDAFYRVQLRYGSSLEPWVTSVDFTDGR